MPSSFSRFLNDAELDKVRELYLQSLAELDDEFDDEQDGPPADQVAAPPADSGR